MKLCELKEVSDLFPGTLNVVEEEPTFYVARGCGKTQFQEGPFSLSKIKQMLKYELLCELSWLLPEEEEDWKQVKDFKELLTFLPPLPQEKPDFKNTGFIKATAGYGTGSITPRPPKVSKDALVLEEPKGETLLDVKFDEGLCELQDAEESDEMDSPEKLDGTHTHKTEKTIAPGGTQSDNFELPSKPIWYIKRIKENSDKYYGPYDFMKVISMLEKGEVTKEDKISLRPGKGFMRIKDQFEFNTHYKTENGKVFIARRYLRVNYMTEANVDFGSNGAFMCNTLDISEGGAQLESKKHIQCSVGDTLTLFILPGLIKRKMKIVANVIRICEINGARFSVAFVDISEEDRASIQDFVRESLEKKYAS